MKGNDLKQPQALFKKGQFFTTTKTTFSLPVWTLWRAQTGQCLGGLADHWGTWVLRHPRPAHSWRKSRHCPHPQWWETWAGGRPPQWPALCCPCRSTHHPSEAAEWNRPGRQKWDQWWQYSTKPDWLILDVYHPVNHKGLYLDETLVIESPVKIWVILLDTTQWKPNTIIWKQSIINIHQQPHFTNMQLIKNT